MAIVYNIMNFEWKGRKSVSLFRPYLRGQDISRWSCPDTGLFMIVMKSSSDHPWPWANAADDETAERLFQTTYPALYRHFKNFESIPDPKGGRPKGLRHREDHGRFWWELRPCAYYASFDAPKTLYVDITWKPSFLVDTRGRYTNNTCYFLPSAAPDVAASLNSPIGWWYAWRKAQHGKDEALRFFTSFMETYPVAPLTPTARNEVASLVERSSALVEQYQVADQNLAEWLKLEFDLKSLKPTLLAPSRLDSDQFLAAVRDFIPKKRKLTVAEVGELKREYSATVDPARRMRAEVLTFERRLSELVNEAYALTEDEVELMWRTAPPRMPFIVLNAVAGDPMKAAAFLADDTRKSFAAAVKRHPTIEMPRVNPRSMAIYERLHVLPSTIVSWHVDNYAEAIRRTGGRRDEAKILVKDIAEWSAVMQDEIGRILPFLAGGRDG